MKCSDSTFATGEHTPAHDKKMPKKIFHADGRQIEVCFFLVTRRSLITFSPGGPAGPGGPVSPCN